MHISYSELILLNKPVVENVKKLSEDGCGRIELMMDGQSWDSYKTNFTPLVRELKELNLSYSVHPAAWDINLTAETEILRRAAFEHHLQALDFCAELGAKQMVVHPGFANSPCFDKAQAQKRAHDAILALAEQAKKVDVKLAFENVGYHGASIYTQDEFIHALDGVDGIVGYLIDIGHAHINQWDIPEVIRRLSDRMFGFHIHDNNGSRDEHRPIGEGSVDWAGVVGAMREVKNTSCEFILEYVPFTPLEKLAEGKKFIESQLK